MEKSKNIKLQKNGEQPYLRFLKKIGKKERKTWRPQKQRVALNILEAFLYSDLEMAEVRLDELPEPVHRKGTKASTKQDSFASSFYAWRKKDQTEESMHKLGIETILLIRRGGRLALKKKMKNERKKSRRKK